MYSESSSFRSFIEFWRNSALLPEVDISDLDGLLLGDLDRWIVKTALRSTRAILEEWGIRAPLREKKEAPVVLEEAIIPFSEIRQNYDHSTSVLCSFPSMMREHRMFNCVGACLLALSLSEALSIDDEDLLLLSPVNHVLIGVRTACHSIFLLDLRNGVAEEVTGEYRKVNTGEGIFVAHERVMDFRYFPIVPLPSLAEILLGNLDTVKCVVDGPSEGGFFDRSTIVQKGGAFIHYVASPSYFNPVSFLENTLCSRISKLPLMCEELHEVERIRSERKTLKLLESERLR